CTQSATLFWKLREVPAMCGIVGLYLKNQRLAPELGGHLETMLIKMSDRGPDSAGFAVYDEPIEGVVRLILRSDAPDPDYEALANRLGPEVEIQQRDSHALALVPKNHLARVEKLLAEDPSLVISSRGESM